MNENPRATLPYREGYLALTDTHLMVVRDGRVVHAWLLRDLSEIGAEEAHTFRHRLFGLFVAIVLLAPSLALLLPRDIADRLALLALFRGKLGLGILFAAIFGFVILWEVVTSRRIWWLRARFSMTPKLVPLPGVDPEALERFVQVLDQSAEGRS